MTTLKDFATAYVPAVTRTENIADLPRVSTKVDILEKEGTKKDGVTKFKYHYIVIDNKEYRVPKTVIQHLQLALKFNPNLEYFKVNKEGTTKDDTKYDVEPA